MPFAWSSACPSATEAEGPASEHTTVRAHAPEGLSRRHTSEDVDFSRDIRPILESRCQPCHFPGGKMYERLPFDQAAKIHTLGPKLFTRIRADDEQALFRRFLAQQD